MREPVQIHKRKPLTPKQRAQIFLDQDGLCGCGCGVKMDHEREGTIDEHWLALALGGSNDLTNRKLLRLPCAKEKTKGDVKAIAKAKRIIKREDGTRRERKKIPSRGFDRTFRKRLNGSVERREK